MMSQPYDPDNIFAKILRDEIPSVRVYEDDHTIAIMDIMPWCDGHCLVLPKAPARNMLDVAPDSLAAVAETTRKLARAVVQAFGADGVTIQQNNEAAGNQVVFHLHVHVIPRHEGDRLNRSNTQMEDTARLQENAAKIKAALKK
ncbi:HIT family protein [Pseudahrensia aquimaris]|uniref:HIT family protein n=1 Tax=Pseudahrensia aquimaris TaxID=744461 RepID=A0ABW3FLC9_9HYPH